MAGKSWFRMQGPAAEAAERVARIDLYGEIGWEVDASAFLRELRGLGDLDVIDLRIQSGGGSVLDGWAIANGLKHHPARVEARVEGLAASMASVIACAADRVSIPRNAYLMIHNVAGGGWGEAEELRSTADLIDKLGDDIADFYAARTGIEVAEIKEMMAATTWLNGEEAVAMGFADELLDEVAAAALLDGVSNLSARFEGVPEALSEEGAEPEPEPEPEPAPEEPEGRGPLAALIERFSGGARERAASRQQELAAALDRATSAEARASELEARVDTLTATVATMEADAKTVWELVSEAGFEPAAELIAPDGGDEHGIPGASIRERFDAIENAEERRKFYQEHKEELLGS